MSAGGATDHLFSYSKPALPDAYCSGAAQFAVQYSLDGVDFDMELQPGDSAAFIDGWATQWLIDCTTAARAELGPNLLISHAPQAPYFGNWAGPTRGYVAVDAAVGHMIDFYNIQYYNQGGYTTYEEVFVSTAGWKSQTAVAEIAANGVPLQKLVLGKPLLPQHASNGWVEVSTLSTWLTRAFDELGWEAGVMIWQWDNTGSDPEATQDTLE